MAAPWHHSANRCAFIAECKHARIRVQQNGEWHSKAGCSDFLERNVWNIYEFLEHTLYTPSQRVWRHASALCEAVSVGKMRDAVSLV